MGIVLGLMAAICYGSSDFAAGLGGRRASSEAVAILAQPFGLLAAIVAVVLLDPAAPSTSALVWGAVSGLGGGVGALALYRGFAVGQMSVVAPLSAVLTAVLPAIVGILTGDTVTIGLLAGLVVAVPAIALVSRQPSVPQHSGSGVAEGMVAGAGFAVLFIGLARAGTASGAWPLVSSEVIAVLTVLGLGLSIGGTAGTWRAAWWPAVVTGVIGGVGGLCYLAATGQGQLSVVAVVTALYPAVTIVLARGLLHERWSHAQAVGLGLAALAVACISLG